MDNLLLPDVKGPQELMKSLSNKQIIQVCKDILLLLHTGTAMPTTG